MRNKLTDRQQSLKQDCCIVIVGACAALALWAGLWTLEALANSTVSVLHIVMLILAAYGVRLFWRIAMRD